MMNDVEVFAMSINNNGAKYSTFNEKNQRSTDYDYYSGLANLFKSGNGEIIDKLRAFPKYVPLPELGRYIARYEIFKQVLNVQGSIVECGVHMGGGIMTWASISALLEPLNHLRKIVGFDTFEGFPSVHDKDQKTVTNANIKKGALEAPFRKDIEIAASLFDGFRPIGHLPKIELIEGDAIKTIPAFLKQRRYFIVSLLYLDFDIYEPTLVALKHFIPRMPKGAVIAFDQLNHSDWPGETDAVMDAIGLRNLSIRRFPFQPQISYAILD